MSRRGDMRHERKQKTENRRQKTEENERKHGNSVSNYFAYLLRMRNDSAKLKTFIFRKMK